MKMKFAASLVLAISTALCAASPLIVGYYPYWAQYSQFYPANVRYQLVTNIHYGYLVPSGAGDLAFADDSDQLNFKALGDSARVHKVKLLVSIGGIGNEEAMKSANPEKLAASALDFLKQNPNVSGVELDWKLSSAADVNAFNALTNAFSVAFTESEYDYLLAATLSGNEEIARAYSAAVLNKLSYLNVTAIDEMSDAQANVVPNCQGRKIAELLDIYASLGVEKAKLVAVVPFYGKSFAGANGLGSTFSGVGSGNEGMLSYKDLMAKFEGPSYKVSYDAESQSEVAVNGSETIVFNGIPSVKAVAENVRAKGFGGVAAFDLSNDMNQPLVSLLVTAGQVLRPEQNYKSKKK